jgi:integrase
MKEINNLPLNINGRLISSSNGDNFKFYWMQLKKWSKVNKTFHSTRHTFASRAAMKGWSIVEIAQQGGWKELRVLKRYTHLKAEYLADKLKQR